MFTFGDPVDTAKLYLDDVMSNTRGEPVPDVHYEELELNDLRYLLVWVGVAFGRAMHDNFDEPALQAMLEGYDEIFEYMVEVDDDFRKTVTTTAWGPPHGWEFREKYIEIARRY